MSDAATAARQEPDGLLAALDAAAALTGHDQALAAAPGDPVAAAGRVAVDAAPGRDLSPELGGLPGGGPDKPKRAGTSQ